MAQEICFECPQQRYATEEPGQEKFKGRDRVGTAEGSSGYRARRVKVQVRDSERCGNCCPLCPTGVDTRVVGIIDPLTHGGGGGQYSGKIRFIDLQGVNGHRRPVPGVPSSGTTRESQAKFRDGTLWGLKKDGFLDKTFFSRILIPPARYTQDPSTIPTRSRP